MQKKKPKNTTFASMRLPRAATRGLGKLTVQIDQHQRENDRGEVRHVRRVLQQLGRQRQMDDDADDDDEGRRQNVVELAGIARNPSAQPRARRDGGVGRVADQHFQQRRLRLEQHQRAEEQDEREQPRGFFA